MGNITRALGFHINLFSFSIFASFLCLGYYTGSEDYNTHRRAWLDNKFYLDLHDQKWPVYNETGHYSTHLFTSKAIQRIRNHDTSKVGREMGWPGRYYSCPLSQ